MIQKILICRLTTIIVILQHLSATENCLKTGKATSCCADYHVLDGKCVPCPSGTFGPDCNYVCTYPDYGRRCLDGKCQCPKEICDPSEGCKKELIISKTNTISILTLSSSLPNSTSEYNVQNNNRNLTRQVKGVLIKENSSSTVVVAVISAICVLVIGFLIVVLLVQLKGKITIRLEKKSSRRKSNVTSHRHVDTYCEIDDDKVIDDGGNDTEAEVEEYEVIDHSKKDATKYTALPSRTNIAKHGSKTMSNVSMQKILESRKDDRKTRMRDSKTLSKMPVQELSDDNAEDDKKVEMRIDKSHLKTTQKRFGKTSGQVSGYIDMDKGTKKEDYVSMCAENGTGNDSLQGENIKE
ncbi:uncharacterized protein LOC133173852 [Saccostrea echinata]|uniref:uncharacterized protein LOC133173852 n=1 Tax=Saccostrea echinata TaxID=191078 RepID=UPI002A83FFCA|nr:uncharacterized protein LOC133173852 [Saccostrea echinata]